MTNSNLTDKASLSDGSITNYEMLGVLPPIAKSIYIFCKKCDCERYHKVLAHKTAQSAKVQCEVCQSVKTYSLPKLGSRSNASKSGTSKKGKSNGSKSESASADSQHLKEYSSLLAAVEKQNSQKYVMSSKFTIQQKLDHSKFGLGIVRNVFGDRIEVVFPDAIRILIHNKI